MAVQIKFDTSHNPELPTFVLATRSGKKLGLLSNVTNVHVADNLNAPMDISFSVHKIDEVNPIGISDESIQPKYDIWYEIKNFRKVWIPEWDKWFTLTYSVDESNETIKNVSLVPNSEFELSNVNIHNLEINTESDISREEYTIPTTFYNYEHPEASLLHRILSYTKGFVIKDVDDTLKNIQRTFALDGSNIYDTLQQVAQEIQCLFVFGSGTNDDGTIERSISAYDLRSYCNDCGYRGDFFEKCPKCGSTNITGGYGNDTTIFVDTEALADSINLTTDTDSVKNCFRLVSGDGLMDAAIMATNPNGTQYLWYFTDEMMEDMSDDLKDKIKDYDEDYQYYLEEYTIPLSNDELFEYNKIARKYHELKETVDQIDTITGYAELMNAMYDAMDLRIYLESGLLPEIKFDTNAQEQADKVIPSNIPYVAVQNLSSASITSVNSSVESAIKILIDSRYKATIKSGNYNSASFSWTGSFTITATSDPEDTADTQTLTIGVTDAYELFTRQKIERAIAQSDVNSYSMPELFQVNEEEFKRRLTLFSRAGLRSILESCNAAIGVMVELGVSNPTSAVLIEGGMEVYLYIYLPYAYRLQFIEQEVSLRDKEIATVQKFYDMLMKQKHDINDKLDINKFLGDKLATELNSYKMEDDYNNSNYISEGLNNAQLFKRADEFVTIAVNEIHKAATEHHSLSTTMRNLLTIKDFEPLINSFAVGNWIRIKVDNNVYRVKLLSYSIDYDNIENLQVEFSDTIGSGDAQLSDIFASAQSMAKSYDSVKYQAVSAAKGRSTINAWVQQGLDLTTVRVTNAENQTLKLDQNGMSMSQYDDVTQEYTDYGSRWINTTLAFTKDNWETTETALGRFDYWNPETGQNEEGYGVVAKQLIGNLILGDQVGIYNKQNSVTINEGGLVITSNGDDGVNQSQLTIRREYTTYDEMGNPQTSYDTQLYIDENGKLVFKGDVYLESDKTIEEQMSLYEQLAKMNETIEEVKTLNVMLSNESQVIPTDKDGNNGNYNDCNTQIYVLYGNSDITDNVNISVSTTPGITGRWGTGSNSKVYYVSNMTSNVGKVTFTVQFNSLRTTKSMSISKAKAGGGERGTSISNVLNYYLASSNETGITRPETDGTGGWTTDASEQPLSDSVPYLWNYEKIVYSSGNPTYTTPIIISRYANKGADAVRYDIVISHAAIIRTEDLRYSPSSITVAAQRQVGDSGLEEYQGRFKIELTTNNEDWILTNGYTSSENEARHVYQVPSQPSGILGIRCSLYKADGFTTLLDQQIVPIATGGVNGLNQSSVYLYQRSTTQPEKPSDSLEYNFMSHTITSGNLGDWTQGIPIGDMPLWVTIASASTRNDRDNITPSEWSTPIKLVENGSDGLSGYNQATLYLYKRSSAQPSNIPLSANSTYTFATGELTNIPTGWSTTIPANDKTPCWVTMASAISKENTVDITGGNWSGVVQLVEDGNDGYTVLLTNENHTFSGNATSALPTTLDVKAVAYKGVNQVNVEIDSISGQKSGEITATIDTVNKAYFHINVTDKLSTSGTLTINMKVGEEKKTFSKEFSYSVALTGEQGIGIASITEYYKASSSKDAPSKSSFTTDVQETDNINRYLWNYERITYTDETYHDTELRIIGVHGANGSSPRRYDLIVSHSVIVRDSDTNSYIPNSITLSAQYQEGSEPAVTFNGYYRIGTTIDNESWMDNVYEGTSYTIPKNIAGLSAIRVSLYLDSARTTLLDRQVIPIITDGKDGTPGLSQATVYLYKRSPKNTPPSLPQGDLTYTFSSKTIVGVDEDINGWSQNTSAAGTDPFWVIAATASSDNDEDIIDKKEWTTPIQFEALSGTNGLNQATVYLYQRSSTQPEKPSGNIIYDFTTGEVTGIPSEWKRTIPDNNGNPCWITTNVAISDTTRLALNSGWSDVVKLVEDGNDAYTVILSNDSHTFNGDLVSETQTTSCEITVYKGTNKLSCQVGELVMPVGMTYTIQNNNSESPTVTFVAASNLTVSGTISIPITTVEISPKTFSKVFSYAIVTSGNSPTRYDLLTSHYIIVKSNDGDLSPKSILFSAQSQIGSNFPEAYSNGKLRVEREFNNSGIWIYENQDEYTNVSEVNYTIPTEDGLTGIRCKLFIDNTENYVDIQTIPVVLDGKDGTSGVSQATIYLYKRFAHDIDVTLNDTPTGTLTYTFTTRKLTEKVSGAMNGWSQTVPTGTDPCWVTIASASNTAASDDIQPSEWSIPIQLMGSAGVNGLNQATIYLYQRSASKPEKPGSIWYVFDGGTFTAPTGWSKTVPEKTKDPCWVTTGVAISNKSSVEISKWSDVVQLAEDGSDGCTVILTNESHTFAGTTDAAKINETAVCDVMGYDGRDRVEVNVGAISIPENIRDAISVEKEIINLVNGTGNTVRLTFKVTKANKIVKGGTLTIPITLYDKKGNPRAFEKQFSYSIAFTGLSAIRHYISPSSPVVIKKTDGTYSPQTLTISSYSQDGNGNPVLYQARLIISYTLNGTEWRQLYDSNDKQSDKYDTSYTVNLSRTPGNAIAYKAVQCVQNTTTQLDQQIIPVVYDGSAAYTVILSNENHTFSGDADSAIPTSIDIDVIAYKGSQQLVTTIDESEIVKDPDFDNKEINVVVKQNGTTSTTLTVSVTDKLIGSGVLHIPIQCDGQTIIKDFTWSVVLAGQPTASYSIEASDIVVKKSYTNELTPNKITFKAFYREGTNATRTPYQGYFRIYEDDALKYPINNLTPKESEVEYNIESYETKIIKCELYSDDSYKSDKMLDVQSVAILSDVDKLKIGSRNLIHFSDTLIYRKYGFVIDVATFSNLVTNENKKVIVDTVGDANQEDIKPLIVKVSNDSIDPTDNG